MLETAVRVSVAVLATYAALVVLTRLVGLRSFSKLSSFDFAITVAFGSVIAGTALSDDPPLFPAVVGLTVLFVLQFALAGLRRRVDWCSRLVDNQPLLLMVGGEMIEDHMRRAQVTKADLWAKLREANVTDLDQVHAVVMETTGDVSVLHGDPGSTLDPDVLSGVHGSDRVSG